MVVKNVKYTTRNTKVNCIFNKFRLSVDLVNKAYHWMNPEPQQLKSSY